MQINTVTFAVLDAEFSPNETWYCPCGAVHEFGVYAAAHWHEELDHKCSCGTERTFLEGCVVHLKEAE